jgi:hypothetical protein
MFNPSSPDTASRPVILTMPGQGEWGTTDYSTLQVYGPHYWLNHGWDGSITLGNGTHYPILITLTYVDGITVTAPYFHNILLAILNAYHIKRNSVHIGGLSQGAFTAGGEITYEATPHDETGMKVVTSLVALQGRPDPPLAPYTTWYRGDTCYKIWAKKYNGKYFTLEGSGADNFRDTWLEAGAMNDTVPGSAYFSYENLGGGMHCCWNDMWNPSNTNWTCVGTLGPNNAPSQAGTNTMGDYHAPCNIFTWMLKQGDTSMVYGDTSTTPSLAASPLSIIGLNGTVGTAGTSQTVNVTFSRTTINASAPSNTEISIDGGISYASSQSLAYSSPAGLMIRTTAGAAAGSISGNLVLSGTGVSSITIPVTGTVSGSGTTPDSARFQFLITPSLLVSGWQGVIGDPSLAVLSGTISGTNVTYSTVSTSSNNWGQFNGACIGASNGVTNATIPDASNSGVMKEAFNTANLYQTTYPQFITGGWKTDGTTYDIELSGTTQYPVSPLGTYNVKGSTLSSSFSISGSGNTSSNITWTNVSPDTSGNFTFYVGKDNAGQQVGMLSYIKIKKHITTPDSARFQFLITPSLLVSGWQGVIGDPSLAVLSGTISGTTITYTTVSASSNNWGQFYGACIGASNGVTNATIPDASNSGVMKEAFNTANLYQTTYPQFISGGWLTDGTTYDIELSGTTQYSVSALGTYSVRGSTLSSSFSISGSGNTSSNITWTNVSPDTSGNFIFYAGKGNAGQQVGMLSYIKIKKHTTAVSTPDSARFQFLITPSLLVSGWQGVIGDPSLAVLSGTISGTTITYTTVSASSNNWGQFFGACIGANNGVTNATIPDASNSGVMKEAFNTANLYQTTYPQFISGGWLTDGTTYDIELSGTTQYSVSAVGTYSVLGNTLNSSLSISGSGNTSSKATWTNASPDTSGNFTFFVGKSSSSGQVGMLSYIKIQKHAGTGGSAAAGRNLEGNPASFGDSVKNPVSLLYPNPTTGQLRVYFTSALEKAGIVLLDAAGHVLQQRIQSGSRLEMDISSLSAGVYILRVRQAANVFTYKVVKR